MIIVTVLPRPNPGRFETAIGLAGHYQDKGQEAQSWATQSGSPDDWAEAKTAFEKQAEIERVLGQTVRALAAERSAIYAANMERDALSRNMRIYA